MAYAKTWVAKRGKRASWPSGSLVKDGSVAVKVSGLRIALPPAPQLPHESFDAQLSAHICPGWLGDDDDDPADKNS